MENQAGNFFKFCGERYGGWIDTRADKYSNTQVRDLITYRRPDVPSNSKPYISIQQRSTWEANCSSPSQEIPRIL